MRIIGGTFKGRIFHPGKKFKARPTTDIAKEGLFNILENRYEFSNKNVLDLFSGTGSMGYEFLSRGCNSATLVETFFPHYKFILEVIEALKIENARVFKADAFKFVQKTTDRFNIIFADPPFDHPKFKEVPDAVLNTNILAEDGLFILEHPKEFDFSSHSCFKELRTYGKVNFSFFEK
ncbi:16S rRNA (guanine(966)-N(2))-methyltransferase RsmD [Draconibacterium sp. IB214405]|uniref:16S rRNA (guanine(966)-N(2))-methyltransferase RsmD n=1 Tax=Draconibacterium sp. IB214405 TaxID=3097352 RepID=UPI002A0C4C52|nr:16S rRNA (guanine(966)-N(2))-methyltransferase RsmD [Draconibacterium sp. IB214405]MDX8339162.1 16S rRNA (guanine(966)-N(2))-methyltransferase RsmD [Draconibacterium sp. IB214405]